MKRVHSRKEQYKCWFVSSTLLECATVSKDSLDVIHCYIKCIKCNELGLIEKNEIVDLILSSMLLLFVFAPMRWKHNFYL